MATDFPKKLYERKYRRGENRLCRDDLRRFGDEVLRLLFPLWGNGSFDSEASVAAEVSRLEGELRAIVSCLAQAGLPTPEPGGLCRAFFGELLALEERLSRDAAFLNQEDPASVSVEEVILCYPGFYAIGIYRIAHALHGLGVPLLPRVLTEHAHEKTGIDIHPGARIGCPFFIDHGTGVVIGETTVIGNGVKLFQGVTLGALSVEPALRKRKRHPTIGDRCLIYSNTTILGGDTVVGEDSIIGGNVWLTHSVPPKSRIKAN